MAEIPNAFVVRPSINHVRISTPTASTPSPSCSQMPPPSPVGSCTAPRFLPATNRSSVANVGCGTDPNYFQLKTRPPFAPSSSLMAVGPRPNSYMVLTVPTPPPSSPNSNMQGKPSPVRLPPPFPSTPAPPARLTMRSPAPPPMRPPPRPLMRPPPAARPQMRPSPPAARHPMRPPSSPSTSTFVPPNTTILRPAFTVTRHAPPSPSPVAVHRSNHSNVFVPVSYVPTTTSPAYPPHSIVVRPSPVQRSSPCPNPSPRPSPVTVISHPPTAPVPQSSPSSQKVVQYYVNGGLYVLQTPSKPTSTLTTAPRVVQQMNSNCVTRPNGPQVVSSINATSSSIIRPSYISPVRNPGAVAQPVFNANQSVMFPSTGISKATSVDKGCQSTLKYTPKKKWRRRDKKDVAKRPKTIIPASSVVASTSSSKANGTVSPIHLFQTISTTLNGSKDPLSAVTSVLQANNSSIQVFPVLDDPPRPSPVLPPPAPVRQIQHPIPSHIDLQFCTPPKEKPKFFSPPVLESKFIRSPMVSFPQPSPTFSPYQVQHAPVAPPEIPTFPPRIEPVIVKAPQVVPRIKEPVRPAKTEESLPQKVEASLPRKVGEPSVPRKVVETSFPRKIEDRKAEKKGPVNPPAPIQTPVLPAPMLMPNGLESSKPTSKANSESSPKKSQLPAEEKPHDPFDELLKSTNFREVHDTKRQKSPQSVSEKLGNPDPPQVPPPKPKPVNIMKRFERVMREERRMERRALRNSRSISKRKEELSPDLKQLRDLRLAMRLDNDFSFLDSLPPGGESDNDEDAPCSYHQRTWFHATSFIPIRVSKDSGGLTRKKRRQDFGAVRRSLVESSEDEEEEEEEVEESPVELRRRLLGNVKRNLKAQNKQLKEAVRSQAFRTGTWRTSFAEALQSSSLTAGKNSKSVKLKALSKRRCFVPKRCEFVMEGSASEARRCDAPSLPLAAFCRSHIVHSSEQHLFQKCEAFDVESNCDNPAVLTWSDIPMCEKHMFPRISPSAAAESSSDPSAAQPGKKPRKRSRNVPFSGRKRRRKPAKSRPPPLKPPPSPPTPPPRQERSPSPVGDFGKNGDALEPPFIADPSLVLSELPDPDHLLDGADFNDVLCRMIPDEALSEFFTDANGVQQFDATFEETKAFADALEATGFDVDALEEEAVELMEKIGDAERAPLSTMPTDSSSSSPPSYPTPAPEPADCFNLSDVVNPIVQQYPAVDPFAEILNYDARNFFQPVGGVSYQSPDSSLPPPPPYPGTSGGNCSPYQHPHPAPHQHQQQHHHLAGPVHVHTPLPSPNKPPPCSPGPSTSRYAPAPHNRPSSTDQFYLSSSSSSSAFLNNPRCSPSSSSPASSPSVSVSVPGSPFTVSYDTASIAVPSTWLPVHLVGQGMKPNLEPQVITHLKQDDPSARTVVTLNSSDS